MRGVVERAASLIERMSELGEAPIWLSLGAQRRAIARVRQVRHLEAIRDDTERLDRQAPHSTPHTAAHEARRAIFSAQRVNQVTERARSCGVVAAHEPNAGTRRRLEQGAQSLV